LRFRNTVNHEFAAMIIGELGISSRA